MTREKVFITRYYHPEAAALLEERYEVEVWQENSTPPMPVLLDRVASCDAFFIESYDRIDAALLAAAGALKVVSTRAVGTDNIDIAAATSRGILIGNTPGVLQNACADFTWGLLLDVARRVAFGDRDVRMGRWAKLDQIPYLGTDVHGKTLGIVGLGGIGQRVARRAAGFEMRVIYHSRTRKPDVESELGVEWVPDLESVLEQSDYVSLHMPLNADTERMIGERELAKMKPTAFLINTTRGRTVDQKALYRALKDGVIAGAALDVTDPEPLPPDDPIADLPNVVITPHIASASTENFKNMARMAAENIVAALAGQPMPSCLNPEAVESR